MTVRFCLPAQDMENEVDFFIASNQQFEEMEREELLNLLKNPLTMEELLSKSKKEIFK